MPNARVIWKSKMSADAAVATSTAREVEKPLTRVSQYLSTKETVSPQKPWPFPPRLLDYPSHPPAARVPRPPLPDTPALF